MTAWKDREKGCMADEIFGDTALKGRSSTTGGDLGS